MSDKFAGQPEHLVFELTSDKDNRASFWIVNGVPNSAIKRVKQQDQEDHLMDVRSGIAIKDNRDQAWNVSCDAAEQIVRSVNDLQDFLDTDQISQGLIASSPTMLRVIDQAKQFARSSATVLIGGESGTGKEVISRLIHDSSPRSDRPYVQINCAAISRSLIESELFGHEKGAFTGAIASRPGLFECAHGGTLLLDEISEMPLNMQAKLLRVLEQEKFQRVGGNQTLSVDVRVVTTTNRSLEEDVENGRFRFDLFHRLNVLQIVVPPVRDRKQDIPPLVRHFIECFQDEGFTPIRRISDSAMQFLTNFDWPGNVRQLRNVVHHACVVNTTGTINERDFPAMKPASKLVPAGFENMSLDEIERHVILSTLQKHNGNKTTAAKQLGVTARTLSNKMRRYRELGFLQSSS